MDRIYRNYQPIPIPDFVCIDISTKSVYIKGTKVDGKSNPKRTTIGKLVDEKTMHPNDNFKSLYPKLWNKYYNKRPDTLYSGLFLLIWFKIYSSDLYKLLIKNTNIDLTNFILDLAMYIIKFRDNTFDLFSERMSDTLLFSGKVYSGSEISTRLKSISLDMINGFKIDWMKKFFNGKKIKVSISVAGSNNDSYDINSLLAEKDHSKSGKHSKIISYVWILDAETSDPIAYFVVNGSVPDCKSFDIVLSFLKDNNAQIEAFIMDHNYCNHSVISSLNKTNNDYLIMMPSGTLGTSEMIKEYKDKIVRIENIINEEGLLGVSKFSKLFYARNDTGYINLYYCEKNASKGKQIEYKKIYKEIKRINEEILNGNNNITVNKDFQDFIKITKDKQIEYDEEKYMDEINKKGFYSIVSSKDYGPKAVHQMYHLWNSSEVGYDIIKNELGCDAKRTYKDPSILSKFFVCFISTIIVNEIRKLSIKLNIPTNGFIETLNNIFFILKTNNEYDLFKDSNTAEILFKHLNINNNFLRFFKEEINDNLSNNKENKFWKNPLDIVNLD